MFSGSCCLNICLQCFSGKLVFYFVCRLVNENEVKQWKEQAEKMRKGIFSSLTIKDFFLQWVILVSRKCLQGNYIHNFFWRVVAPSEYFKTVYMISPLVLPTIPTHHILIRLLFADSSFVCLIFIKQQEKQ